MWKEKKLKSKKNALESTKKRSKTQKCIEKKLIYANKTVEKKEIKREKCKMIFSLDRECIK